VKTKIIRGKKTRKWKKGIKVDWIYFNYYHFHKGIYLPKFIKFKYIIDFQDYFIPF